ncbi:hypothetical protein [Alkalicoccus urumqiensis]|uniref:Sporulation protein YjcZ n=1 Tax=Alkalicoccus urumqiensis TaxID=1548213 RepID=A0A2P6MDS7_ALKUR|nr:hypothetical protein [Alkalicoccus urumqiensis]PRO64441.1 hypothetical protein C6I21_14670 [Alkalicoccus urumqiensis]
MLNRWTSALFLSIMAVMTTAVPALAASGDGEGEGGGAFTEIIFTILAVGVLFLFIFYMVRDNAS